MRTFVVVVNRDSQYSIWPNDRELPSGWATVGVTGDENDCLGYIGRAWADLRAGRNGE